MSKPRIGITANIEIMEAGATRGCIERLLIMIMSRQ